MNPGAAINGLRARLAARPDTEHEQAIVRLFVGTLIVLYLLPSALATGAGPHVYLLGAYFAASWLIFLRILSAPQVSPPRRICAAVIDLSMLTFVMVAFGEEAAALFCVYIWVTLANGFRFGARYLLYSLALSIAGFGTVLWLGEFWQAHRTLGVGLMVGLVMLSLYVRSLVTKLFEALSRAEAANEAKRRFISVVSHEMRTPLNAIIGMSDLLRDTRLSREQADMLQTLRGSSRVMLGLVEDVLDFSKIEAGKLSLERIDFDLHALINSTCRIVSAQAAAKNVEFVVSIMPQVPPAVRGDPHHLRQILLNLIVNAVKFTEQGSVTVHVTVQGEAAEKVWLKFSVRDTGIGIPPEAQDRIFESFTQAERSTMRRFGGTGLGTTIAKQLVDLMGGRIGLESAVGLGTTFWVELQLEKQPVQPDASVGALGGARMMLLGFPPSEAAALAGALADWGAQAVQVEDAEEAGERLVEDISLAKPCHSVLVYATDAGVARQRVEQLRRSAPNPAPLAILCAAPGVDLPRFAALSAGYAAVLELPFEKRQLFNVLHSVTAGEDGHEGVVRLEDFARRGGGAARKLRVLVADDNATNREVVGRILERAGHVATLVNDGEDALDALDAAHYDIVLLDRNMERMGGIETLRAIRMMGRGLERLPVIVLSADVTPEARRESMEAGADAFMSKPVEALRLLEALEEHARAAGASTAGRAAAPQRAQAHAAAAPAGVASQVLNLETIGHLEELGSGREFIEKLFAVFISDNVALLKRLEGAFSSRNVAEVRNLLHAMKGSAASMGAERLTQRCTAIGRLSDGEIRLQSAGALSALTEEFDAVRDAVSNILESRRKMTG